MNDFNKDEVLQEIIHVRQALAKALGVVELCFRHEGDYKNVESCHLFSLMAVAEDSMQVAYKRFLDIQCQFKEEDEAGDLALQMLELSSFLNLMKLSEEKAENLDACGLLGFAQNACLRLLSWLDACRAGITKEGAPA